MNAGPVAFRLGLRGMTIEAEARIVERDIRLLREIEAEDGVRARLRRLWPRAAVARSGSPAGYRTPSRWKRC